MFNRMKQLLNISSRSSEEVAAGAVETVVAALDGSSELVISEDKRRVRRARALMDDPAQVAKEIDERSLVAGPFRFDIGLEEIQNFMESIGAVRSVRMRRHMQSKDFRGSVFVEFTSVEEAARVLKASKKEEDGKGFVFDGAPLDMETKLAFLERKAAERLERDERRDDRRDDDRKRRSAACAEAEDVDARKEVTEEDVDAEIGGGGMLVQFKFGLPEEEREKLQAVSFGLVKDSMGGKDAGLAYVEYNNGDMEGCVRFTSGEMARAAIANAVDGKMMIAGFEAEIQVLAGDEERTYVKNMLDARKRAAVQRASRGGKDSKRGGRGRGGRNSGYHKRQRKM
jgi:lupus La protein